MFLTYTPSTFLVASWCVTVWDGLLRLDDEVAFIWPCVAVFFHALSRRT